MKAISVGPTAPLILRGGVEAASWSPGGLPGRDPRLPAHPRRPLRRRPAARAAPWPAAFPPRPWPRSPPPTPSRAQRGRRHGRARRDDDLRRLGHAGDGRAGRRAGAGAGRGAAPGRASRPQPRRHAGRLHDPARRPAGGGRLPRRLRHPRQSGPEPGPARHPPRLSRRGAGRSGRRPGAGVEATRR